MDRITIVPGLMQALGIGAQPIEGARSLQPEATDPALKAYRRRRQIAHRRARTQRRINMRSKCHG